MAGKVYIELMRSATRSFAKLPLLAAGVMACPQLATAQGFAADYDLIRMAAPTPEAGAFNLGAIRMGTTWQANSDFSGAGLSVQAGRNWFGQVGVGRTLQPASTVAGNAGDVFNVGGGYRWTDGQALSLQVSRGRGPDQRLGLAVSYDWPRYFVRFSYDSRLSPLPQDNLRFSAGMRF